MSREKKKEEKKMVDNCSKCGKDSYQGPENVTFYEYYSNSYPTCVCSFCKECFKKIASTKIVEEQGTDRVCQCCEACHKNVLLGGKKIGIPYVIAIRHRYRTYCKDCMKKILGMTWFDTIFHSF